MIDLYLKFPDEQTAIDVLNGNTNSIDIIGTIYKQIDSNTVVPLDGWHVNIRGDFDPAPLSIYSVQPVTPIRTWA